jgi:hypothetical protein
LFLNWEGPAIIGGDFNLVRSQLDKSNGNIDHRCANKFNAWVELWDLVEIGLPGRAFTWANNQENLIMSRIDRFFCTTELKVKFPLAHARALPRVGSDHIPIIWNSGFDQIPNKSGFKFEKWWLSRPDFSDLVAKAWALPTGNKSVIDSWHDKCKYFRRLARGWSANLEADIRKHKKGTYGGV